MNKLGMLGICEICKKEKHLFSLGECRECKDKELNNDETMKEMTGETDEEYNKRCDKK